MDGNSGLGSELPGLNQYAAACKCVTTPWRRPELGLSLFQVVLQFEVLADTHPIMEPNLKCVSHQLDGNRQSSKT